MAGSAEEYIAHHLTNLTYGQLPDGSWGFAQTAEEVAGMGFWSLNVDSMAWAIGLGLVFSFLFRRAAVIATAGVPGGLQNFGAAWCVGPALAFEGGTWCGA